MVDILVDDHNLSAVSIWRLAGVGDVVTHAQVVRHVAVVVDVALPAVNAENEARVNEGEEEMKHQADKEELADLQEGTNECEVGGIRNPF